MADLADLADAFGLAVSRGRRRRDQAAHYGKPLFIADLVVAEVGDRAAAWLSAQRATFRARAISTTNMNGTAEQ